MHKWIALILCFTLFVGFSHCHVDFEPVVYEVQTATPYQCHEKMEQDVSQVLDTVSNCLVKQVFSSCQDVIDSCGEDAPSGYYDITASNGTLVNVYCDMEGANCDGKGGWMRVGWLDMSEPGAVCPGAWTNAEYNDIKVCVKWGGCAINYYETHEIPYSEVCGMVRGYQYGSNDAFQPYYAGGNNGIDSDGRYTDGIQITYDNERQHIWAYVIGVNADGQDVFSCPCNEGSRSLTPTYVHDYYYCEAAAANGWTNAMYSDDPLWDGEQCDYREGPCCTNPKMPWFYRDIGENTTSSVEVRICADQGMNDERVPIDRLQLYVR